MNIAKESNGMATAGFVLSLIGAVAGWIPVLGWILWLLGLIFSVLGLVKSSKVSTGKGLAIAGLCMSFIGVIIFLILILFFGGLAAIGMAVAAEGM